MERIPKIGDTLRFTPSAFSGEKTVGPGGKQIQRELSGEVIYMHPQRRYYTVAAEIHGYTIRESFNIF